MPAVNFTIPSAELAEFHALTKPQRESVLRWLSALAKLTPGHEEKLAAELATKGFSARTLRRKWAAFTKQGWRALVNEAMAPKEKAGLPLAFRNWFWTVVQGTKNDGTLLVKPAQRQFMQRWAAGHPVEGLGTWQDYWKRVNHTTPPTACPWSTHSPPPGLSYRTLAAIAQRGKRDKVAARHGEAAAAGTLIGVKMDLATIPIFREIVIDDFRADFKMVDYESGQIVEPRGIAAMDTATRKILDAILIPRVEREDGTKQGISMMHMKRLITRILATFGMPTDYPLTFVVENASAAVSQEMEEALKFVSGGNIYVRRTSLLSGTQILGFKEGNKGNPNAKLIETSWRLAWHDLASIAGNTGANYQLKHAAADARFSHALAVLKATQLMSPRDREQAMEGILHNTTQAAAIMREIWERHGDRQNHEMAGFQSYNAWRFRNESHWHNAAHELPPTELGERFSTFVETRILMESPNMKAARLLAENQPGLQKLPQESIAHILADSKNVSYTGTGSFRLQFREGSRHMPFYFGVEHLIEDLKQGEYVCRYDSREGTAPEEIHILSKDGQRYIGTAKQRMSPSYGDLAELREAQAEAKKSEATLARAAAVRTPMSMIRGELAASQSRQEILALAVSQKSLPEAKTQAPSIPALDRLPKAKAKVTETTASDALAALADLLN